MCSSVAPTLGRGKAGVGGPPRPAPQRRAQVSRHGEVHRDALQGPGGWRMGHVPDARRGWRRAARQGALELEAWQSLRRSGRDAPDRECARAAGPSQCGTNLGLQAGVTVGGVEGIREVIVQLGSAPTQPHIQQVVNATA